MGGALDIYFRALVYLVPFQVLSLGDGFCWAILLKLLQDLFLIRRTRAADWALRAVSRNHRRLRSCCFEAGDGALDVPRNHQKSKRSHDS